MNSDRVHLMAAGVWAIVGLMICPAVLTAQESGEGPPARRERGQRRGVRK